MSHRHHHLHHYRYVISTHVGYIYSVKEKKERGIQRDNHYGSRDVKTIAKVNSIII
jgi:hypothetical protein